MINVFIDGSAGTTGLRIHERLAERKEIRLLSLPEALRKDPMARKDMLAQADIAFLCLPDDAARESAALAGGNGKIIDTSTAHRCSDAWAYGFPELKGLREKIRVSSRVANPGCHASGFVALVAPLVQNGILTGNESLTCFSLTGYSGGGKKMIAQYEDPQNKQALLAPRQYGLTQSHKHLPEMVKLCGLEKAPVFCPIVGNFYAGMEVTVPLTGVAPQLLRQVYGDYYKDGLVRVDHSDDGDGMLSAGAFAGRDDLQLGVYGNEERCLLVARFDNLGKGASGAAIQNMNILLGLPESTGLHV